MYSEYFSMQDWQLIREYVDHNSEDAFSELVGRHLNLVYSTCLREVGNSQLAEDVTQIVFVILARKARTLSDKGSLAGWLFQTARFTVRNVLRQEERRQQREQSVAEVVTQQLQPSASTGEPETEDPWPEIERCLHDALGNLKAGEREAILLRFFSNKSLREIGATLGISEDAARMRIARSLKKLHDFFLQRGLSVPVTLLALLLQQHAIEAAPASLLNTAVPASKAAPPDGQALFYQPLLHCKGVLKTMFINKIQTALISGVALFGAAICGGFVLQASSHAPADGAGLVTANVRMARIISQPVGRILQGSTNKTKTTTTKLFAPKNLVDVDATKAGTRVPRLRLVQSSPAAPVVAPAKTKPDAGIEPKQKPKGQAAPAGTASNPSSSTSIPARRNPPRFNPVSPQATDPVNEDAEPILEVEAQIGHKRKVSALAYSPDGALLASGGADHTIRLWDTKTGALLKVLKAHTAGVTDLAFTPDGQNLLSVAGVTNPAHTDVHIRLWEVKTGKQKQSFEIGKFNASSMALSPDGKLLAGGSGTWDKKISLWNLSTGELISSWEGHKSAVVSLTFSPDNSTLASGGGYGDAVIKLWDTKSLQLKSTLPIHPSIINKLAYSPDGALLLSGGAEGLIKVWDVTTGQLKRTMVNNFNGTNEAVVDLEFSSDGQFVASVGSEGVVGSLLWNVASGRMEGNIPGASMDTAFAPDKAVFAYGLGNSVQLWDSDKAQIQQTLLGSAGLRDIALSPDGSVAGTADESGLIRLWNLKTGELKRSWQAHAGRVFGLEFSSDGHKLLSGGGDGAVSLWEGETARRLWTQKAFETGVRDVAFTGSRSVAGTGRQTIVKLWSRETGKAYTQPDGTTLTLKSDGNSSIMAVSSPQGGMDALLAIGSGNDIVLRDPENYQVLHTLRGHTDSITALAFSADGRQLVSGSTDKTARLWDVVAGKELRTLATLDRPFSSVAFSTTGLVALGFDDLRLIEAATGRVIMASVRGIVDSNSLTPEPGHIRALQFSRDGKWLYVGSEDGALRVWAVKPSGLSLTATLWPVLGSESKADDTASVAITPSGYFAALPQTLPMLRWSEGGNSLTADKIKTLNAPERVQKALSGMAP